MKKKHTLDQWQQIFTKEMKPTFEGWVFLVGLLFVGICYDLEHLFNIELQALSRISAVICTYTGFYYLCWIFMSLLFAILVKIKQYKKQKYNDVKEINDYENK